MTTLDIMVDVDDVLFPLAPGLHAKAHEMGLHDNTVEALEVWHGWLQYGVPKQRWLDAFDELLRDGFYVNALPVPGAVEAIRRLHWAGHRIHIVTARGFMEHGEIIREQTHQWLEEFAVPRDTVTFAKNKVGAMEDLFGSGEGTGAYGRFDYAIDDGPHNYEDLDNAGVPVYLLNVPHNKDVDVPRRVATVDEFVDIILKETA